MFAPHNRRPSLRVCLRLFRKKILPRQRFPKECKSARLQFQFPFPTSSSEFCLPINDLPSRISTLIGEISRLDPPEIAAGEARVSTPATASPNKRPVHRYTNEPRRDTRQPTPVSIFTAPPCIDSLLLSSASARPQLVAFSLITNRYCHALTINVNPRIFCRIIQRIFKGNAIGFRKYLLRVRRCVQATSIRWKKKNVPTRGR